MKADYLADPWLDIHDHARLGILETLSMDFARPIVKQINFGLIYGMGVDLMALKAGCTPPEAKSAKRAVLTLYPGLSELQDGLRDLAANFQPLRTWGGRLYFCEAPKMKDGRMWTFEYKMLNRLVQGSAADQTKQAIINYYETKPKDHYLLLTVHDELLSDVPEQEADMGMEVLRKAMEFDPFEIPMLSEGKLTATNWAELVAYDKKGERVM
jgi:DNA polymerase-1